MRYQRVSLPLAVKQYCNERLAQIGLLVCAGHTKGRQQLATCVRVDAEELERSLTLPRPGVVCGWC